MTIDITQFPVNRPDSLVQLSASGDLTVEIDQVSTGGLPDVPVITDDAGYLPQSTISNASCVVSPNKLVSTDSEGYIDRSFFVGLSNTGITAPANPVAGMLWLDTNIAVLKIYTGSQWSKLVLRPFPVITNTGSPTTNTTPQWDWSSDPSVSGDSSGNFQYRLDGGSWSASTTALTYTAPTLSHGIHTLEVREQFFDGDWSKIGSNSLFVDLQPPVTVANPSSGQLTYPATIILSKDELGTTYYTLDGSTPTNASIVYTSPIALVAASTLKYYSVDALGHTETVKTEIYT